MTIRPALIAIVLWMAPAATLAQEPVPVEGVRQTSDAAAVPVLLNPGALIAAHDSLYPVDRRRGRRRAPIEMSLVVGRDGVPDSVAIVRSRDRAYDTASVQIARRMRFSPAPGASGAAPVRVRFTMEWDGYRAPSRRADIVTARLYGDRPHTPQGALIYDLYEVAWLGDPPRPLNLDVFRQELVRQARAVGPGINGTDVTVALIVGLQGEVVDARITEINDPQFAQISLAAARLLRFAPGQMFGGPVHVEVLLPIRWR